MEPHKTDQPAPHAGEREKAASQENVDSDGHVRPQAEELPAEERPQGRVQPDADGLSREQRKLAEDGTGF
jgi:hypothetical protein